MRNTTLNIRGIGGELFRRGNVKRIRKSRARSTKVFARLHGARVDPLGAVRSGQRAFQDDWRAQWFDVAADHVRFDLLPEKWYVDYRMGHWNGPLAQSKPGYINVVPLLSPAAARKNMELSVEARSSDRFHFEVMSSRGTRAGAGAVPRRHVGPQHRRHLAGRSAAGAVPGAAGADRAGAQRTEVEVHRGGVGPHLRDSSPRPSAGPRWATSATSRSCGPRWGRRPQGGRGQGAVQLDRGGHRPPRAGRTGHRRAAAARPDETGS